MPATSTSETLCSIKAKNRYREFSHVLCITGIPFKLQRQQCNPRSEQEDPPLNANAVPKSFIIDLPHCGIACTYDLDSPFMWTVSQESDDGLRTLDIDALIRNTILLPIQHTDLDPLDISCLILARDDNHERGVYLRVGVFTMINQHHGHQIKTFTQANLKEMLQSSTEEPEATECIKKNEDGTFDIDLK
jgi:hypothetical protein